MRVVVVGAGASGVCSALLLARYGHTVALLEAGPHIAPLLRGFIQNGVQCDTGFHIAGSLGKEGILRRYMHFIGIAQHLQFVPYDRECCELFRFTSGANKEDVCLPQEVQPTVRYLSSLWPEHAKAISEFFSRVEESFFHSPFIVPTRMSLESFTQPCGVRLREYLGKQDLPTKLKSLLTARCIYYGTPPSRALFGDMALVTYSMMQGVHGIYGGGAALGKSFDNAVQRAGITVKTNTQVDALGTDENNTLVSVTTTKGEHIPCDACIYTGHPSSLPNLLPKGSLRPSMRNHLLSLEDTHESFMMFGRSRNNFLSGRSMLLCCDDDLDAIYADTAWISSWVHLASGTPDAEGYYPVVMGTKVCRKQEDPAIGRDDTGPAYTAWKKKVSDEILHRVRSHVPELADWEMVESSSGSSLARWIHGSTGSIYGVMHDAERMPVLPFTRVKNLYLAGQSVTLPGLLGTFVSAAVACGAIVGYEKIFRDLACTNVE